MRKFQPDGTPWHTDRWFRSPGKFDADIAGDFRFSSEIQIHDVTLRDSEQQAGLIFCADDKTLAEALAEAGVHRLEAGMPAVSKEGLEEAHSDALMCPQLRQT